MVCNMIYPMLSSVLMVASVGTLVAWVSQWELDSMPIQWKPIVAMCSDVTQVDDHCVACVVPTKWKRREVSVFDPVHVPSSFDNYQLCCILNNQRYESQDGFWCIWLPSFLCSRLWVSWGAWMICQRLSICLTLYFVLSPKSLACLYTWEAGAITVSHLIYYLRCKFCRAPWKSLKITFFPCGASFSLNGSSQMVKNYLNTYFNW